MLMLKLDRLTIRRVDMTNPRIMVQTSPKVAFLLFVVFAIRINDKNDNL